MTNPYAPPLAAVRDIEVHAHVVPAERGARLGAAILDSIIFMIMVYVPMIAAVVAGGAATEDGSGDLMLAVGLGLALIGFVVWCYLTIRYMTDNGQSIAKKLVGIKVVRADGTAITVGRLIWMRNVLNWVISIIPFYGLIDAVFIFGESRQCLHDRLADTIVVKA